MPTDSFIDEQFADFTVKVNSLCNAECAHCFQYSKSRRELDLMAFVGILPGVMRALAALGTRRVMMSIVGGEPCLLTPESKVQLIHVVLPAVARASRDAGLRTEITVISNLLVGPGPVEWLAELGRRSQALGVPLQYATSYETDTGRFDGNGSALRWEKNVAYLRTRGRLSVQVTLTRGVCLEVENIIEELAQQFDSIDFQPLVSLPGSTPDAAIVPDYSELADALAVIRLKQAGIDTINLPLTVRKPGFYLGVDDDGTLSTAFSEEIHCNGNRVPLGKPDLESWLRWQLTSQMRDRIRRRVTYGRCRTCPAAQECTFGFEKLVSAFEPLACHGFPGALQASL